MKLFNKNTAKPSLSGDMYPEFAYHSQQLVRFLPSGYVFTILLVDGSIIHYEPDDVKAFSDWLNKHHIPNIHFLANRKKTN